MAQYRGTVNGQRGMASRLGSKRSGLEVRADGWHVGCRVSITWDEASEEDIVRVYRTQGSAHEGERLISEYRHADINGE